MDTKDFVKEAKIKLEEIRTRAGDNKPGAGAHPPVPRETKHGLNPHDLEVKKGPYANNRPTEEPRHAAKTAVKPATFDGSTPWQDYIAHFQIVSQLNGWQDTDRAMYLASCLRGPAQAVLSDLDMRSRYSFTALTEALNRRFCSEDKAELNRTLLKNRMRKKTETLPELAQNLRRLAKNAYPGAPLDVQDSLAKDQFMDAINDANLRWQIFQARPKTLDEALEIAVENEAFKTAESQRSLLGPKVRQIQDEVDNVGRVESANNNDQKHAELLKTLIDMFGQMQTDVQKAMERPRKQRETRTCFNCGRTGHIQKFCREPKKNTGMTDATKNGNHGNNSGNR